MNAITWRKASAAAACVLGAAALAIAVRVSKAFAGVLSHLPKPRTPKES